MSAVEAMCAASGVSRPGMPGVRARLAVRSRVVMVTSTSRRRAPPNALVFSPPLVSTSERVAGPAWLRRVLCRVRSPRTVADRAPGISRNWPSASPPIDRELDRPLCELLVTPLWLRTNQSFVSPR